VGTSVKEGMQEQILVLTPTVNQTTLSGTIPALPGMTVVIDWLNGYAVNASAVVVYGSAITIEALNDLAEKIVCAYEDGFATTALTVRSCFADFVGGAASVAANQASFSPRVGQAVTVTVTVSGVAVGTDGWIGGIAGYHYELL